MKILNSALLLGASLALPVAAQTAPPLVLAIGGEPDDGFDPIMGWGRHGNPLFFATLLRLDANLDIVGDLATDWSLSQDRLTWSFTLREDAIFADGTPLTAADVAFTFNAARDAGGLADLQNLAVARARGSHMVELELKQPQITFIAHVIAMGIVAADSYGPGHARAPIGAGPFRMIEWREGEQLIVAPNPHWHGGQIAFPRITFVFGGEATNISLARTGVAQLAAVPPSEASQAPSGMRPRHLETVDNRGVMFPMVPAGQTREDGKPIGNDVTADRAIRVAVNQLLDREALVALALDGHGSPARGPVDGLPWDNPAAHLPGNAPHAAIATLEAAGWVDADGTGIRAKDGREARFRLIYPAADSLREALALGVAEQARAVGITIEPSGRSWDEISRLMHSDAVLFGWGAHDPAEIHALYHGDHAGQGWFNTGYYRNRAVDAHFDAAQSAESFEASLPHWQAAQWDGTTGFGARGDAAWAWLVNIDHNYWVDECLDLGALQVQPHGHGYPITHDLQNWRWNCE